MTVAEVARKYGISKNAVYVWIKKGLPVYQQKVIGKRVRMIINQQDLDDFLTKHGEYVLNGEKGQKAGE